MATAIFWGFPEQGHTNPTLPIIAELVQRGEHVIYYSVEEYRAPIEATGANYRTYGNVFPFDYTQLDENGFNVIPQLMQASRRIIDELFKEVKDMQPDYIFYDSLAAWGHYLAQILRIPAICSMAMLPIPWQLAMSVPSLMLMGLLSADKILKANTIGRQLSREYPMKSMIRIQNTGQMALTTGQMTLVYTSRYFQPFAGTFDETFKFVGSSFQSRPHAPAFPFETLRDAPLLYISLGTNCHRQNEFYRSCFLAFAESPYQVILAVGRYTEIEQLDPIPENFIVRCTVPQLDILQRAALFITHVGMNSVSEALYYGVPLIAIPQATDQHYVARRVAQLGAGIHLPRKRVTAERLRHITDMIFRDSSYVQASAKIGESFRQAGGFLAAVEAIQDFKQRYNIK